MTDAVFFALFVKAKCGSLRQAMEYPLQAGLIVLLTRRFHQTAYR